MEEVQGIPDAVPSLPLYPPESIRSQVPPEEWQACIDVWLFAIDYRLRLKSDHFSHFKLTQDASGLSFLLSYMHGCEQRTIAFESGSPETKLHHHCYFLLKRLLLTTKTPFGCTAAVLFEVLGCGSTVFYAISDWKSTLRQLWKRNPSQIKVAVESGKSAIVKNSPSNTEALISNLGYLKMLVRCLPEIAMTVVAGVDYLESLMDCYHSYSIGVQREATESTYYSLRFLMSDAQKHPSLLQDTFFELKSEAERMQKNEPARQNLLSSILCSTPILRRLKSDPEIANGKRGQGLIEALSVYRQNTMHLHPPPTTNRKQKGKGRANTSEELHMHKASKISQLHDLFPALSNGYVLRLLDHFSDDVEAVTAALLEPDSLPPELQDQNVGNDVDLPAIDSPPNLAPRSTPPLLPQRRNVFDNDEFDKLQISSSRLHQGRKELIDAPQSADQLTRNKAAIMAALANFDSDDDERDDTYDIADVGASIDNTVDSDERRNQGTDKNEETLFRAWKDHAELFARDSKTRISKARQQLKIDTNMGDEQIEGWAIMMTRDPKMADRLQAKYSMDRSFRGQQHTIDRTSWRADASLSDSQGEGGTSSDGRRVGQAGIRGARQWNRGRGRGGNTSGPADEKATQLARKRKEQGRGRGGAAHNRREGRAKKMGRGMGPLPQS